MKLFEKINIWFSKDEDKSNKGNIKILQGGWGKSAVVLFILLIISMILLPFKRTFVDIFGIIVILANLVFAIAFFINYILSKR